MLGAACRLYAGRRSPRRPYLRRSGLPPVAPSVESSRRYAQRSASTAGQNGRTTRLAYLPRRLDLDERVVRGHQSLLPLRGRERIRHNASSLASSFQTRRAIGGGKAAAAAADRRTGGQTGWGPFCLAVGLPLSRVHAGPSFADRRARRAAELFQRRPPRQHAPLRRVPFESGCLTRLSAIRTFRSRVEATPSE